MSRLTRDGTPEPVSRDQILRHERGDREEFIFPVQLADHEQDWQPCPVVMATHISIALHTYRCSYAYNMHIQQ